MPTALITGAAGQDGTYLTRLLRERGYQIFGAEPSGPALDRLREDAAIEAIEADLGDEGSVEAMIRACEPDEVYNFGAISSVELSWKRPVLTAQITALGPLRLLEAVHRYEVGSGRRVRVLQPSSAEIFGHPAQVPQTENTPVAPVSPYGAAKAFAHFTAQRYRDAYGMHVSTVILYNHESPLRTEQFVTRKVSAAVARISRGQQDRLLLGNLDVQRDWGFAGDYVEAMRLAVAHREPGDYILATGQAHSLREFIDCAFNHVGITDWAPLVGTDPKFYRPADPLLLVGDPSKAEQVLGWRRSTDFAALVGLMVDADLAVLD